MKSLHHQIAFSIISKNPNVLLDDEPLDNLLEDISSALQDAFDLGFKASGRSIYPLNEAPEQPAAETCEYCDSSMEGFSDCPNCKLKGGKIEQPAPPKETGV